MIPKKTIHTMRKHTLKSKKLNRIHEQKKLTKSQADVRTGI